MGAIIKSELKPEVIKKMEAFKKESQRELKPRTKNIYKWEIIWFNVIVLAILHLGGLYGLYLMLTGQVKVLTSIWFFLSANTSTLGLTMGAHRFFTHKTFKANFGVRAALMAIYSMAGDERSIWMWVRDHRQHHKYSDTDGDIYNASRGFFFSHVGWLMVKKQPEVIEGAKTIDMTDMDADSIVMFQKKYHEILYLIFSVGIPTLVPYYFWNENLLYAFLTCYGTRQIAVLNGEWCINSVTHIYGNRPFSKDILPTENGFVSSFAAGEGWHNYHHSFPWDYKAAEVDQHFNFSKTVIEFCARHGWAWDLKVANPDIVRQRILKRGDGTHHTYGRNEQLNKDFVNEDEGYEILKRDAETQFSDKVETKAD